MDQEQVDWSNCMARMVDDQCGKKASSCLEFCSLLVKLRWGIVNCDSTHSPLR